MIKAIIFDGDGPLYGRAADNDGLNLKLLQQYGYKGSFEEFAAKFDIEKFRAWRREVTVAQMLQTILQSLGLQLDSGQLEDFVHEFNVIRAQLIVAPNALKTLQKVRSMGLKTCVLTDSLYPETQHWEWFNMLGLGEYLDAIVSSYDTRQTKDSAEAYQAALDRLGVESDEAIFVGHQQYEMDGCVKAHVRSITVLPISKAGVVADYTVESLAEVPGLVTQF